MSKNIFEYREAVLPLEYPQFSKIVTKTHNSFWEVEHFKGYEKDVKEFKVILSPSEQEAAKRTMLAISSVENFVKTFWVDIYGRLPKPEIANAGYTIGANECYDDKTEVLTSKGWKYFKDVLYSDEIAQYNIVNEEISFSNPSNILIKEYEGKMHLYRGRSQNLKVTPNHDIIVKHPSRKFVKKAKSCEGVWGQNYLYPSSGKGIGPRENLTSFERVLIAIQADGTIMQNTPSSAEGNRRDITFNLRKEVKIKRLENLLEKSEIQYRKTPIKSKDGFFLFSFKIPDPFNLSDIKNFGWVDLKDISSTWASEFIEELSKWDSTKHSDNLFSYYNCNLDAINKVQAISVLSGKTAFKSINRTAEQSSKVTLPSGKSPKITQTCYKLNISNKSWKVYVKRQEVDYKGKVYCVTVPEGNIVVRREGSVSICGNCVHQLAYQKLLDKLGLQSSFQEVLTLPVMADRMKYLKKYKDGIKSRSPREFTKSLILFTLLVENVSLFSQFLIMSSFYRYTDRLVNFSDIVGATSVDEDNHGEFGSMIVNVIKEENPEWFDQEMEDKVRRNVRKAHKAEQGILQWIFEKGELDFLSYAAVEEYIKFRFNDSLAKIGYGLEFPELDQHLLSKSMYMEERLHATTDFDFFYNTSSSYSKASFSEDDMW